MGDKQYASDKASDKAELKNENNSMSNHANTHHIIAIFLDWRGDARRVSLFKL